MLDWMAMNPYSTEHLIGTNRREMLEVEGDLEQAQQAGEDTTDMERTLRSLIETEQNLLAQLGPGTSEGDALRT